ncbi:hypothetical protein [Aliikangiella sp. IMCC44359]|uniref:hypothetical protein n=1 Tax=Aliikangiella sp. IMCC44359 TaxID=3459125 RepID=UPI00403AA93B
MKYKYILLILLLPLYANAHNIDCSIKLNEILPVFLEQIELGNKSVAKSTFDILSDCDADNTNLLKMKIILAEQGYLRFQKLLSTETKIHSSREWLQLSAYRGGINSQYDYGKELFNDNNDEALCWVSSSFFQGNRNAASYLLSVAKSVSYDEFVYLLEGVTIKLVLNPESVIHTYFFTMPSYAVKREKERGLDRLKEWLAVIKAKNFESLEKVSERLFETIEAIQKKPQEKLSFVGECRPKDRFPVYFQAYLNKLSHIIKKARK